MCESLLAFLRICDNFAFLRDVSRVWLYQWSEIWIYGN